MSVPISVVRKYLNPRIKAQVKSFLVVFDDGADGFISGEATPDGFVITSVDEKGNRGTDWIPNKKGKAA